MMKKVLFLFLAAILLLGIAGCAAKQANDTQTVPQAVVQDNSRGAIAETPKTGSVSVEAAFIPSLGHYQSTATGTIDAKAPLTDARVEVYTKTDGDKKVVAAAMLGDIAEDKMIDVEIIISASTLTYKIGTEAGLEHNGITTNKKTVLGIDVISGDVKTNWESKEFSFDDDDAFKAVTQ